MNLTNRLLKNYNNNLYFGNIVLLGVIIKKKVYGWQHKVLEKAKKKGEH